jgi:hypothetical protein
MLAWTGIWLACRRLWRWKKRNQTSPEVAVPARAAMSNR